MLKTASKKLAEKIDLWCTNNLHDGRRKHLGASEIGGECSRALWYNFRWCGPAQPFNGRMLRLFERGHREEDRFIRYLCGIGATVWEVDANGKQFGFSDHKGHFGGHIDGVCQLPPGFEISTPILCEFKTQGTGTGFTNLRKNGVKSEKPQHYAQMCVYGVKFNLTLAVYMAVNKNDDDLHIEIVELNSDYGNELVKKAKQIIDTNVPPERVSENSAYFKCKFCNFLNICHNKATIIDKNCRACAHSVPGENATWQCVKHAAELSYVEIDTGCPDWQSIA